MALPPGAHRPDYLCRLPGVRPALVELANAVVDAASDRRFNFVTPEAQLESPTDLIRDQVRQQGVQHIIFWDFHRIALRI